jgi:hypothetical protein
VYLHFLLLLLFLLQCHNHLPWSYNLLILFWTMPFILLALTTSCTPNHPLFQCLAEGGCDTFYWLFYLYPDEVQDLSSLNTSVSPPTWMTLSCGNQSALLTLIAYQWFYKATHKATHNGTRLTPHD